MTAPAYAQPFDGGLPSVDERAHALLLIVDGRLTQALARNQCHLTPRGGIHA
jgi:hypothetical protein